MKLVKGLSVDAPLPEWRGVDLITHTPIVTRVFTSQRPNGQSLIRARRHIIKFDSGLLISTWISGLRLDYDPRRMTGTLFTLFAPSFGQYPLPGMTATKWLIVLKHRIDHRQNFSPHGDLRRR